MHRYNLEYAWHKKMDNYDITSHCIHLLLVADSHVSRHCKSLQQVLEDVSQEHARKTVTVETFPHDTAITAAAIHPCKHAVTMKKLSGMMEEGGKTFSVDQ